MILALQDTIQQAKEVKNKLAKIILSLDDNPNIKRIKGAENCFTMNYSQLDKNKNLSPLYYDFKMRFNPEVLERFLRHR